MAFVADDAGVAVAKDNSIHSNFAFAPMKFLYHKSTDSFFEWVNPFGTYHGCQYSPPTRGNRHGYEVTLLAGEQFASSAPTYNAHIQRFALLFAFFKGDRLQSKIKGDLISYANPPLIIPAKGKLFWQPVCKPLTMPKSLVEADIKDEKTGFRRDSVNRMGIPLNLQIRIAWTNFCRILVNTVTN